MPLSSAVKNARDYERRIKEVNKLNKTVIDTQELSRKGKFANWLDKLKSFVKRFIK
jgi:hypothetical protein